MTYKQTSYDLVFERWAKNEPVRIIGVDTGLANIGWGIIDTVKTDARFVAAGVLTTDSSADMPERLHIVGKKLKDLINEYNPVLMAYEELFFNQRNMMKLNLSVGVIIYIGWQNGLNPKKFRPQDAKYLIAGSGRANKDDLANAVALHLGLLPSLLKEIPDHATDALAHALCYHAHLCDMQLEKPLSI